MEKKGETQIVSVEGLRGTDKAIGSGQVNRADLNASLGKATAGDKQIDPTFHGIN